MAFLALLWKARTIERYRLNYEREKMNSIMITNAKVPNKTIFQRFRHYRYDTKKRLTKFFRRLCPEGSAVSNFFIYLKTDQTFPNFLMKSVLGFLAGIIMTYLCFMFFVFQLSISLLHATFMSCIIGVLLTLGLAFSYRVRCLVFLLIPQFFSKMGRYTLTCYALVLILTGPATNTLRNSEVLSESMACGQEQLKASVKQVAESIKKPFNSMKDTIKHMIDSVKKVAAKFKETLLSIHRLVMSIVRVMESAFSWLSSIVNICNKKVGTPYERCTRALNDGVLDCRARLGPYFSWLCNVVYVAKAACLAVKPLDVICVLVEFVKETIVATIKRKLRVFSNHVKTMLYVNVHIHHSYSFSSNASRSASQVAAGIVTEIRHRAEPLLTWLALSSCVTSLFFVLIIFRAKYYQHMFETRSRFDNNYITKELRDLDLKRARENRETVLPLTNRERAKYVDAKSFRLVAPEKLKLSRSVVYMLITTFKLLVHIVADYSLYWVLMTIRYHGRFQSPILPGNSDAGVKVAGDGAVAGMMRSLIDSLGMPLSAAVPSPISCLPDPYPPDFRRYTQIGILILLLWFSVFFEPYGLRLRHVVMGLYRPERAKARAVWLYNHLLRTRAGFLKLARRKLHRNYKYWSEQKFTFRQWLDANIPCWWLRALLGTGGTEAHCLLCGTTETLNDPDGQLYKCDTPDCPGIFCARCFADIGQMCTICMSPIDYGDISDVSLEKGSSAESSSTETTESDDDEADDNFDETPGKSRNSDADDSDSSPPKSKILSNYMQRSHIKDNPNSTKSNYRVSYLSHPHNKKGDKGLTQSEAPENPSEEVTLLDEKQRHKDDFEGVFYSPRSKTMKVKYGKVSNNDKISGKKIKTKINFPLIPKPDIRKYFKSRTKWAGYIDKNVRKNVWEKRIKCLKKIINIRGSKGNNYFIIFSDRESLQGIKSNVFNSSIKSYTTQIKTKTCFQKRLAYSTKIRRTHFKKRNSKKVQNTRLFLQKYSSTVMFNPAKILDKSNSNTNYLTVKGNPELAGTSLSQFLHIKTQLSNASNLKKTMTMNENSFTAQKDLLENINKEQLRKQEVEVNEIKLNLEKKDIDKYKITKLLQWSFWKNHISNIIAPNLAETKKEIRSIGAETEIDINNTDNDQSNPTAKLDVVSSQSWIRAHYDREVGIMKPTTSELNKQMSEIKRELKLSIEKRKVDLKPYSKEAINEFKRFEWREKAQSRICSCPATKCSCVGEHAEPLADVAGYFLPKQKRPYKSKWLNKMLKYLHKNEAALPAGTLLAKLQRVVDDAQKTSRDNVNEEKLHAVGSEYCLSRCPQFFKSSYVDKSLMSNERRFTKLKRKMKFIKGPPEKVIKKPLDEASFQDLRDDDLLSDGLHSAGPSHSKVSLEGEDETETENTESENELYSLDLSEEDSRGLIHNEDNTKFVGKSLLIPKKRVVPKPLRILRNYDEKCTTPVRKRCKFNWNRIKEGMSQLFKKLKYRPNDDVERGTKMSTSKLGRCSDYRTSDEEDNLTVIESSAVSESSLKSAKKYSTSSESTKMDFESENS